METETKVCRKCGVSKPYGDYYKRKVVKSGLNARCKVCIQHSSKKYADTDIGKKNKKESYKRYKSSDYYLSYQKKDSYKQKKKIYQKSEEFKESIKKYRRSGKAKITQRLFLDKFNETDNYFKIALIKQGFLKESITPEIIEVKRLIIKTKRLCRTSFNSENLSQTIIQP